MLVPVGCTHGYELERLPGAVCGVSSWSAFQAHDAVILVCRTKSRNGYKRVIKANPIPSPHSLAHSAIHLVSPSPNWPNRRGGDVAAGDRGG